MNKKYIRWQSKTILSGLTTRRVIFLAGARQCGKTTLVKELISPQMEYRTLDDNALLQSATSDPLNFVKHYKSNSMIIDEIQRAPELLPAIKKVVDEDTRNGQYLLAGSANIQAYPASQESLAGRVRKIRLRTLSQGEIHGIPSPDFLKRMFIGKLRTQDGSYEKDDILNIAIKGGFPEPLRLDNKERKLWHKDYIETLLEKDLKDIARIQHKDAMGNLFLALSAWSGKLMDISAIGSGLSITRPTIESYINAFESLYIIERIRPWTKTDYTRIGKQDKIFITDCGLMSSVLNWHPDNIRLDDEKTGKLIETFVFNELSAQIDASKDEFTITHYRDREKREIDFIIENEAGALLGIEVKSSSSISKDDFRHIKFFAENLAGKREFKGIVLYSGKSLLPFGNNMTAVPISHLWNR